MAWATDPAADVRLAPYDVVYVPRSGSAEVFRFFYQYFLQYVPVSWGFSYSLGPSATTVAPPPVAPVVR